MESVKTCNTGTKNFLANTWKRCRRSCFPCSSKSSEAGFIPVHVGPEKQRFAVKTKYVNHPLFTMLLDQDAEMEYGYKCEGPIWLPCDVDLFYKVFAEMEAKDDVQPQIGWSTFAYGSCSPFNPRRRLGINGADQMAKGYGYYEALTSCMSLVIKNYR